MQEQVISPLYLVRVVELNVTSHRGLLDNLRRETDALLTSIKSRLLDQVLEVIRSGNQVEVTCVPSKDNHVGPPNRKCSAAP